MDLTMSLLWEAGQTGHDVEGFDDWWDQQVEQYPPKGPPGLSYFKGDMGDGAYVDCLLYRDKKGKLIGILNHYPFDFPPHEQKGNINVMVDPKEQGKGVGKVLLKEAIKRWDVNLDQQNWTPQGHRLRMSLKPQTLKLGKKMKVISLKKEALMSPSVAQKLTALRAQLEYVRDLDKTPVLHIKPIPVKSNRPEPTVRLPDDEPDENDCKRVGAKLKTVFGRKMCIEPDRHFIVGNPAVTRRVREALESLRQQLEVELSESRQRHCALYLASDGNWYLELADDEYAGRSDSTTYGPFPDDDAVFAFLDNFSNPGSYHRDTSGKQPPPEKSPDGSPVRKVKKRGSRWDW